MEIAILTQPLRANYGGVLQNYALQQVLIKLGHTPITLEKNPYLQISKLKLFLELPKRLLTKYILKKRKYILYEKQRNNYIKQISSLLKPFIYKYINRKFVKSLDLIDYKQYDAFIVGSDQIWRPLYNWGIIDKMFLSFIPKEAKTKRIAYAASFGTSEWEFSEEQTKVCSKLIKNFNAVSTREIDGIDLCRKYLDRNDVVNVLDPTLLLEKEDYSQLCKDVPTTTEDLLFAYILDETCESKSILEKIAKEKGLKLKLVGAHDNCTLTIEEWLATFRDAKMVITDSFHGTVFSIVFNREFYSICNQSRGNSRFNSLLSQFCLQERLINAISDINCDSENIDWNKVEKIKSELKNSSIQFLTENL